MFDFNWLESNIIPHIVITLFLIQEEEEEEEEEEKLTFCP